jgi:two-component system, OmpR family, sensor histidine kinase KdpD
VISWTAARWGQGPGILAAGASALAFDFLFIPPFFTFNVGSLEGWLLLAIFLLVAIVVVGRVQVGIEQAKAREREAIFMYELSSGLAGARGKERVAHILGGKIQQFYQAELVQVFLEAKDRSISISIPSRSDSEKSWAKERIIENDSISASPIEKPDLVLAISGRNGLMGEIRIWQGKIALPEAEDRLLKNYVSQAALAFERASFMDGGGKEPKENLIIP